MNNISINKKIIILLMGMILLAGMMSAEVWLWEDVNIQQTESVVNQHGFFQFEDTSDTGVGRNKPIDVILHYDILALPYNLSAVNGSGEVDWCNFTITHIKNEYDDDVIINTTTIVDSYYFSSGSANGDLNYEMKDTDSLIIDMRCHYTNSSSLFFDNVLFGKFTTYFGGFKCNDCEKYSLEELSNAVELNDEVIAEQNTIYDNVQAVIGLNYQLWTIAVWLVKIGFLIIAVSLVFYGVYFMYKFFRDIEEKI